MFYIQRQRRSSSEHERSLGMSFTKSHGSNKDLKGNDTLMSRLVQEERSQKGAVNTFTVCFSAKKCFSFDIIEIYIVFVTRKQV